MDWFEVEEVDAAAFLELFFPVFEFIRAPLGGLGATGAESLSNGAFILPSFFDSLFPKAQHSSFNCAKMGREFSSEVILFCLFRCLGSGSAFFLCFCVFSRSFGKTLTLHSLRFGVRRGGCFRISIDDIVTIVARRMRGAHKQPSHGGRGERPAGVTLGARRRQQCRHRLSAGI